MTEGDPSSDRPLLDALRTIQARGPIGGQPLRDAVDHSNRFVGLIPPAARSLADLGSGGGLPGLVIAWRRPQLAVTLIERRRSRADLLQRAVLTLGLRHVTVAVTDVAAVVRTLQRFDVVTARSFADPAATLAAMDGLLSADGVGLVSEPPHDRSEAWATALGKNPRLVDGGVDQGIRRLVRPTGST